MIMNGSATASPTSRVVLKLECVDSREDDEEETEVPTFEMRSNEEVRDEAPHLDEATAQSRDEDSAAGEEPSHLERTHRPTSPYHGEVLRLLSSPTASIERIGGDEVASFNLFQHSFDTMSERGDSPSRQIKTPPPPPRHNRDCSIDIALPALDYADISPIKLVTEERRGHRRSPALLDPLPVSFAQRVAEEHAARYPHPRAPQPLPMPYPTFSNPIFVLRTSRKAFVNFTFLLSCLRDPDPCSVHMSQAGAIEHYRSGPNVVYQNLMSNPKDLAVATRRVEAAVCAFGGTLSQRQSDQRQSASIFRPKGQHGRSFYEEAFHHRYSVTKTRVSWDVEEHPPVELSTNTSLPARVVNSNSSGSSTGGKQITGRKSPLSPHIILGQSTSAPHSDGSARSARSTPSPTPSDLILSGFDMPKLKYRCKLCGQPKQNHSCPYRRSVQRSIGVMVQPVPTSFTAHEPGELTPALSEMNNFVSYDSADCSYGSTGHAPAAHSPLYGPPFISKAHASVTPDGRRTVLLSPQSSLSTNGHTPETSPKNRPGDNPRKRSHSGMDPKVSSATVPSAMVNSVPLRPEQYRAVTPGKMQMEGSFTYPAVPIPLAERRRLSDTLFVLSKRIPPITEECSIILNDARGKGMWDLAVAELLTQVVTGLFCMEGDRRLEGLHRYLLGHGISC